MEGPLSNTPTNQEPQENTPVSTEVVPEEKTINLYPLIRHMFLIVCILLTITIILFLIYQNGKSLYDKGL